MRRLRFKGVHRVKQGTEHIKTLSHPLTKMVPGLFIRVHAISNLHPTSRFTYLYADDHKTVSVAPAAL